MAVAAPLASFSTHPKRLIEYGKEKVFPGILFRTDK
jgi:hypothetical protein